MTTVSGLNMNPSESAAAAASSTLSYSIAGCSDHSHRYVAENILVDSPTDQSSRWSGVHEGPNMKQWLLLKLDELSVVESITFGKFHKQHPCNVKEFKIYIGLTEDHLTEVLHSGLKNDSVSETFALRHVNSAGVRIPTRFLKIVPLSAHGHSFHISIWFVSLAGIDDEAFMSQVRSKFDEYREKAALRHILKHLRKRRFMSPFKSILSAVDLEIEHPLITQLYEALVSDANWSEAENVIRRASEAGLFDSYLHSTQPRAVWKQIYGLDANGDVPSKRGGHAMCIDGVNGKIYLFGGWDGHASLGDFWVYSIKEDRWQALSRGDGEDGRNTPGPRSCHKMVFDSKTESVYMLGRLSESDEMVVATPGQDMSSPARRAEFYRYRTTGPHAGIWEELMDTSSPYHGPPLLFDHQMAIDPDAQVIYVCGGRLSESSIVPAKYAGLYAYNITSGTWQHLIPEDKTKPPARYSLTRRHGHSMVLDPVKRKLYVFAGLEDDSYLSDMHVYDITTNESVEIFSSVTAAGGPEALFTHRAVMDPSLNEIYVFCGLNRAAHSFVPRLEGGGACWMYRYNNQPGTWTKITQQVEGETEAQNERPRPRYAHQIVYDTTTKTAYLHGGNSGRMLLENGDAEETVGTSEDAMAEQRLDDFWSMQLRRPQTEEVVRRAIFQIRCQHFREMCHEVSPVQALRFLQTDVNGVVDHDDPVETGMFRDLLSHLLLTQTNGQSPGLPRNRSRDDLVNGASADSTRNAIVGSPASGLARLLRRPDGEDEVTTERFRQRTEIFETLLKFFPPNAKEPGSDLIDIIDWCEESTHA